MGDKTKIDWCDASWNPVTGCLHGCEYCYARGIAERFGMLYAPELGEPGMEGAKKYDSAEGMNTMLELVKPFEKYGRKQPYPMAFLPTFHRYRLDIPARWTKPRTIFVCSMADLFGEWVPDAWIKDVFDACMDAPHHRYLFLTKNPQRYIDLIRKKIIPPWYLSRNMWFGSTATVKTTKVFGDTLDRNVFMSIEPIMEPFHNLGDRSCIVDWVIVGAETGNRKGKIVPEKDWIMELSESCTRTYTPIFMKESLRGIMGDDFRQEFPWEV